MSSETDGPTKWRIIVAIALGALLLGGAWLASPSERGYIDIATGRARTDKLFIFITTRSTVRETYLSRWSNRDGERVWRRHETWGMMLNVHMPWFMVENYSTNFMSNLEHSGATVEQKSRAANYFLNQFARIDAGLFSPSIEHANKVRDVQLAIEALEMPKDSEQLNALLSSLPEWDVDALESAP